MNTILIIGVSGFIGRYISREFAQGGWNVVGLGIRPPENAPRQNLSHYHQLVLPSNKLDNIVKRLQPQVCIHCAGRASVNLSFSDPYPDFSACVDVTFNLLDALRRYASKCRLIYLSSAAVYGNPESLPIHETDKPNPISPYGFHKRMSELLCAEFSRVYQLPTCIVRIFSAYGPGLRRQVLWDICQKALTQPVLKLIGTGNESRDFIHVQDIARAINILVEKATFEAEVYNLSSGIETKISNLAELMLFHLERKIDIEFDGILTEGNPLNWRADISRLFKLGFKPEVSLERGTEVYAQWCRAEVIGW